MHQFSHPLYKVPYSKAAMHLLEQAAHETAERCQGRLEQVQLGIDKTVPETRRTGSFFNRHSTTVHARQPSEVFISGWRLWGLKTYDAARSASPVLIVEDERVALLLTTDGSLWWAGWSTKQCDPPTGWMTGQVDCCRQATWSDIAQLDLYWERVERGRRSYFRPVSRPAGVWGAVANKKLTKLRAEALLPPR